MGLLLGAALSFGFLYAEKRWGLLPGEVYKLERVDIEFRLTDLSAILGVSMLICYLSTLAPARRGAKLPPVEGLRYD
jgi:lipoprotein-releasing system permease protein